MAQKENDMFLNLMANPTFSPTDFESVGLNGDNTSLQSEDVYKNNERIQKAFTDKNGKFDEAKFNGFYKLAAGYYNVITNDDLTDSAINKRILEEAQYSKDNIWIDAKQRTIDYAPKLTRLPNERLVDSSLTRIGKRGELRLSISEIAQTQKVWDTQKQEWTDAPNDSLWSKFFDTLVLAQYDEDEYDEQGNLTHKKGEYKLNDEGTYYYETLGGREVYGKQVLNKMNILTTDGSFANKFDFFDSDDIEQKSFAGSLMKNLALVGSMFIPYVGPIVAGVSVATLTAGFLATIGKMMIEPVGAESAFLNNVLGWAKSVNRQTAKTDYASQHTWCMENMLNMIGDTIGLLKEQRFIFSTVPALLKGSKDAYTVMTKGGAAKLTEKYAQLEMQTGLSKLIKENPNNPKLIKWALELQFISRNKASKYIDDLIKSNTKIGSPLSKAYMTAITVQDTYGEAKAAGASDIEAALLTLGYAAGEAAILNTGLGEWIMPELHGNKFRYQAIAKALGNELKSANQTLASQPGKEAKMTFIRKLLNIGKGIANDTYANAGGAKVVLAHAGGEAFEEVSEELLADMSKSVFNVYRWLTGKETLDMGQWDNMVDRYGMSAIGGFIGGGVTSAATDFGAARHLSKMNNGAAMQELIYLVNNGLEKEFLQTVEKMDLGNKNLSANRIVEGTNFWQQGTETDNQDAEIKRIIRNDILLIKDILETEGAKISTDSLLNKLSLQDRADVMKDIRLAGLQNTKSFAAYLQDYQNIQQKLIQTLVGIKEIKDKYTDGQQNNMDANDLFKINKLTADLVEIRKQKDNYLNGNLAPEAARRAIFEMNPIINSNFIAPNVILYAKNKTGKNWNDLSAEEQKKYTEEFNKYQETAMKDDIISTADVYHDMVELFSLDATNTIEETKRIAQNQSEELKRLQLHLGLLLRSGQLLNGEGDTESIMSAILQLIDGESVDAQMSLIKPRMSADKWQQLLQMLNQEIDDPLQLQLQRERIRDFVYQESMQYINDIVQQIVELKYLHPELKRILSKSLNDLMNFNLGLAEDIDPSYYDKVMEVQDLKNQIEQLYDSPVLSYLDKFRLSATDSDIVLSKHLDDTYKLFAETETGSSDITDFSTSETWRENNEEALKIIKAFKAVINGMRIDNADIDNPTGYTRIFNNISKKVGVKDFQELAEIDSQTADLVLQDVELIENRLEYAKSLDAVNRGLKLKMLDRVAANKNYLVFNLYKRLVNVIPDDWIGSDGLGNAKQEFLQLLDNSKNLIDFSAENKLKLNNQERYIVDKEMALLEHKLYRVFQRNKKSDGSFDVDKLQEMISRFMDKNAYFQYTGELLTEESKFIDDNSFLWHLASKVLIDTIAFLKAYRQGFSNKIAPVPTQEMAVLLGVAAILNGNGLNAFVKAYRQSAIKSFNDATQDERVELLRKVDSSPLFADLLLSYYAGHDTVPQYENMVFIEGIPGTGKSTGVIAGIVATLKNIDGGADLLNNAIYAHVTKKSAQDAMNNVGLSGTAMNKSELMTYISLSWKDTSQNMKQIKNADGSLGENAEFLYDDSYTFKDGKLVNNWSINNYSDAPKVIFIDEITHYNLQELSMIEQFAKAHGAIVITAGDLDQYSKKTYLNIDGQTASMDCNISRNYFVRTPKLGTMFRGKNKQIIDGILQTKYAKDLVYNSKDAMLEYKYYEDAEKGLHGIKAINYRDRDKILATIEIMKNTLDNDPDNAGQKQKIGYIYKNENSETYKLIKNKYGDIIQFYKEEEAQGLEGQYYIVELNDLKPGDLAVIDNLTKFMDGLYTGISRAKQAALVIAPDGADSFGHIQVIKSYQESSYEAEFLNDTVTERYMQNRAANIDNLLTEPEFLDIDSLQITPVTKENIQPANPTRSNLNTQSNNPSNLPPTPPPLPTNNIPPQGSLPQTNPNSQEEQLKLIDKLTRKLPSNLSDYYIEHNGTKLFFDKIYLKDLGNGDFAALVELVDTAGTTHLIKADELLRNFQIFLKTNNSPIPLYNIDDQITLIDGRSFKIINIDTTGPVVQYDITDIDGQNPRKIDENEIKAKFKEYYVLPVVVDDELLPDDGNENDIDEAQAAATGQNAVQEDLKRTVDQTGNINHIGYTFNMFEQGGIKRNDDGTVGIADTQSSDWQARYDARIDSGIGLHKLLPNLKYDDLILRLATYYNVALTTDDNAALANYFKLDLNLPGNVKIRFGIKSSARPNNSSADSYGTHNNVFYQYDFSEEEEILHLLQDENLSKEEKEYNLLNRRKKLILLINHDGKNVLELPLISFNNCLTYLNMKLDPNDPASPFVFDDVSKYFFRLLSAYKALHLALQAASPGLQISDDSTYKALVDTVKQFWNDLQNKDIIELIKFYLISSNGYLHLDDDFNFAKSTSSRGPELSIKKGELQLNNRMKYVAKIVNIHHFINNPRFITSSLISTRDGKFNNQIDPNVIPGHTYMLVALSDTGFRTDEDLMKQYIKQISNGYQGDQKVQIFLVVPPFGKASDWIINKHNLYQNATDPNKRQIYDIGNSLTSYRIIQSIIQSGHQDLLQQGSEKTVLPTIMDFVNKLLAIENKWNLPNIQFENRQINGLNEKVAYENYKNTYDERFARKRMATLLQLEILESLFGAVGHMISNTDKVKDAFTAYLTNMVYTRDMWHNYLPNAQRELQMLDAINTACDLLRISYKAKYSTDTLGHFNKIQTLSTDRYSLGDDANGIPLNFQINARIDTPSYMFDDLSQYIEKFNTMYDWSNGVPSLQLNQEGHANNAYYLNSKILSSLNSPLGDPLTNTISAKIKQDYKSYFDNGKLDATVLDDSLSEANNLERLIEAYNNKAGNIGFIYQGKMILGELADKQWKIIKRINYNLTNISTPLYMTFESADGKKAFGYITFTSNPVNNNISEMNIAQWTDLVQIQIQSNNFSKFDDAKTHIINEYIASVPGLAKATKTNLYKILIESQSAEEFINKFQALPGYVQAPLKADIKNSLKSSIDPDANNEWYNLLESIISNVSLSNIEVGSIIRDAYGQKYEVISIEADGIKAKNITLNSSDNGVVINVKNNDLSQYLKEDEKCGMIKINI